MNEHYQLTTVREISPQCDTKELSQMVDIIKKTIELSQTRQSMLKTIQEFATLVCNATKIDMELFSTETKTYFTKTVTSTQGSELKLFVKDKNSTDQPMLSISDAQFANKILYLHGDPNCPITTASYKDCIAFVLDTKTHYAQHATMCIENIKNLKRSFFSE